MKYQNLIEKLYDCAQACNECADACLSEDNLQKMIDCIRTDRKCAIITQATAEVLTIEGQEVNQLLEYCKTVCEECAEECGKHDTKHCQKCEDACRTCAEACESEIGAVA